jgi:hypothetical protein
MLWSGKVLINFDDNMDVLLSIAAGSWIVASAGFGERPIGNIEHRPASH